MIRLLGKFFNSNWSKNKIAIVQLTVVFLVLNISIMLITQINNEKKIYKKYEANGTLNRLSMIGGADQDEDFEKIHGLFDKVRNYEYVNNVYLACDMLSNVDNMNINVLFINKASAEKYYKDENIKVNSDEGVLIGYKNPKSNLKLSNGLVVDLKGFFRDSVKDYKVKIEDSIPTFYTGGNDFQYDIVVAIDDYSDIKYMLTSSIFKSFMVDIKSKIFETQLKEDIMADSDFDDFQGVDIINDSELMKLKTSSEQFWLKIISAVAVVLLFIVLIGLIVWIYYAFSERKYEYGIRLYIGSTKKGLITLILAEISILYCFSYLFSWGIIIFLLNKKIITGETLKFTFNIMDVIFNSIYVLVLIIITFVLVNSYVNKISIGKVIKGDVDAN